MVEKRVSRFLFFIVFVLEMIAGYYVCHIKSYVFGDAISRVANAFYVIYINPPHLAAIGAVWNPLPSLLCLPLLLLKPIYMPVATSGLAAVFWNSIFAAGSGVLIYRAAIHFKCSHLSGICLALLYCFNPFMFVYGFNGMTEGPFSFMLVWLIISYTQWITNQEPNLLVKMAIALMLAFLIRYEAVPVAASTFLALVVFILAKEYDNTCKNRFLYIWERVEGKSLVLLAPFIYAIFIWILYNWIIMGDPLYFMHSQYSNAGFTKILQSNPVMTHLINNPLAVLRYIFFRSKFFLIPLLPIVGYRMLKRRLFQWDMLVLIAFVISTNALQFQMLSKGLSMGWFRFFVYPFPFIVAWLPYELKKANTRIFTILCIGFLIIADIAVGFAWFDPKVAPEEFKDLSFCSLGETDIEQRNAAKYINNNLSGQIIMMDSFRTYLTIMNCKKTQYLVISSSYQFAKAVKDPRRYKIDYILVPSITDNDPNRADALNRQYPDLYDHGAKWCTLEKEFGRYYRLYRINKLRKQITSKDLIMKEP
jgi:hypothetical protein